MTTDDYQSDHEVDWHPMAPPRELPVRSFSADTSVGGVDLTICACGVVLVRAFMSYRHIDACPVASAAEADTSYTHTVGWLP
jgi:hypothetical protein